MAESEIARREKARYEEIAREHTMQFTMEQWKRRYQLNITFTPASRDCVE